MKRLLVAALLAAFSIPSFAMDCVEMKDVARETMKQRQVGKHVDTRGEPMRELLADWAWSTIRYYPKYAKERETTTFAANVYRMCRITKEGEK